MLKSLCSLQKGVLNTAGWWTSFSLSYHEYKPKISKGKWAAIPCSLCFTCSKEAPIFEGPVDPVINQPSPKIHCLSLDNHKSLRIFYTARIRVISYKSFYFIVAYKASPPVQVRSSCMFLSVFQVPGLLNNDHNCITWLGWQVMLVKHILHQSVMAISPSHPLITIHCKKFLFP